MTRRFTMTVTALATLALISPAAQERAAAPPAQERATAAAKPVPPLTPLKLQVLFARYNGDRKISSTPYTFAVNATRTPREAPVSIRMGVQVPVPMQAAKDSAIATYQYRNVGTNIDCWVMATEDGRFNVNLNVEESSIFGEDAQKRNQKIEQATGIPQPPQIAAQPMFRSFNSSFSVLLKDGETTQYVTATDPVSGEILKIDVTLNAVK